jgi:hypothetical protein
MFVYLISIIWLVVFILFLPFVFLYRLTLAAVARSLLRKKGKDIIVVINVALEKDDALIEFMPVIGSRSIVLNYGERHSWPRWSLPALLFHPFGPTVNPDHLLPRFLPTVILLSKSFFPVQFTLGSIIADRDAKLQQLRDTLAVN